MPAYYDLLSEFGPSDAHEHAASPAWVLAVVRFKYHSTYDRTLTSGDNRSIFFDDAHAVEEMPGPPLIISSACTRLRTFSSKGAHASQLSATLLPVRDYVADVLPGDWVFAWIVNSRAKAADLIRRIRAREACNDFMDGFKFMGRVQGVRESFGRDREGHLEQGYNLSALGFTEFDSSILYFPQLEQIQGLGAWMQRLGIDLNKVVNGTSGAGDAGALSAQKILPVMLRALLGKGLPTTTTYNSTPLALAPNPDAPAAYLVPSSVGALLGRKATSGALSYSDLLDAIVGVQHYQQTPSTIASSAWRALVPTVTSRSIVSFSDDLATGQSATFYDTGSPLAGQFTPDPPTFDFRPIWELIGCYLNPGINEMYVTLRVSPKGKVVPTFIARQLPFSTPTFQALNDSVRLQTQNLLRDQTYFHELPRWKIPLDLVLTGDTGTSDSLRFNMVQIDGISADPPDSVNRFVRNPPIRDDLDIKRSGVRPFQRTVNCSFEESAAGPRDWTVLAADITMGQHLTRTGQLTLVGIQAPITVGDNAEFNGTIYHIENVTHDAGLDRSGSPHFTTSLALSHGMANEALMKKSKPLARVPSESLYPGLVHDGTGKPVQDTSGMPGVVNEE